MKIIQPANPEVEISKAKDYSEISDLYLVNQQLVEENAKIREDRPESEKNSDPLSVKIVFKSQDAAGIAGTFATLAATPFVGLSLVVFGTGEAGSVITGVSFVFLLGIIEVQGFRLLYGQIKHFCMQADLNIGMTISSLSAAAFFGLFVLAVGAIFRGWALLYYIAIAVFLGYIQYGILKSLFHKVHPSIDIEK